MPKFSTEVPHQLGAQAATERLKSFLDQVKDKYQDQVSNLSGDWEENVLNFSLTTYGFTIDGTLTVEEQLAKLSGTLPMAASFFRGKIEESIAGVLQRARS